MLTVFQGWSSNFHKFHQLATRTQSPFYQSQMKAFQEVNQWLKSYSQELGGQQLRVQQQADLFVEPQQPWAQTEVFWDAFLQWHKNPDVLIFRKDNCIENGSPLPSETSIRFGLCKMGREQLRNHIKTSSGACLEPPCYERQNQVQGASL
jgi:hypothetical protein